MERHQWAALAIFAAVTGLLAWREGLTEPSLARIGIVFAAALPILFYRGIAWLSSFGFPEYFARDFGSRNHPGPYAFFFWMVYLIVCAFMIFGWTLTG